MFRRNKVRHKLRIRFLQNTTLLVLHFHLGIMVSMKQKRIILNARISRYVLPIVYWMNGQRGQLVTKHVGTHKVTILHLQEEPETEKK